jgi:hypothetical protein
MQMIFAEPASVARETSPPVTRNASQTFPDDPDYGNFLRHEKSGRAKARPLLDLLRMDDPHATTRVRF